MVVTFLFSSLSIRVSFTFWARSLMLSRAPSVLVTSFMKATIFLILLSFPFSSILQSLVTSFLLSAFFSCFLLVLTKFFMAFISVMESVLHYDRLREFSELTLFLS